MIPTLRLMLKKLNVSCNYIPVKNEVVDISTLINTELRSRLEARNVRYYLLRNNLTSLKIDFSKVTFISRSFADEFYNQILINPSLEVKIVNLRTDLSQLVEAVKRTQLKKKPVETASTPRISKQFKSVAELNQYLNTLSFL